MPHFDRNRFSLQHSVGHLISLVNQLKDRIVERQVVEHDLTAAQFKIVMLLSHGYASTSTELVRILNLDSGAMTRMLDRLAAKHLITRERSAVDRRQLQICLTERGKALGRLATGIAADTANELTGCLSAEELAEFQRLLKKILVGADALPPLQEEA